MDIKHVSVQKILVPLAIIGASVLAYRSYG